MSMKPKHCIIEKESLMQEWDYGKNNALNLDPSILGMGSHTKVWWKCSQGHSWYAMISNRSGHNRACPYCAHQLPIFGETDFATLFPELVKEWHPTKNGTLNPSEIMPGTHKRVWWRCDKGHEWQAEVKSRTTGVGCPYCSNKRIIKGFNDLETINPEIAKEWHPTKNGTLKPSEVSPSSGKRVWWLCKYKHEWQTQVCNRVLGRGCPKCSDRLRTSFPEQAIFYYIKQAFPDAINGYKDIFASSMELDIFIPSLKVGIEYDGKVYHSNAKNQIRDSQKYNICKKQGIMLIRIREMSDYAPLIMCDHKIEIPKASDEYLNWAINNLCYYLGKIVMPDVRRDRKAIMSYLNMRKTSLASEFPRIASEWNHTANYPLVPESFSPHANEKVSWKCSVCGHIWDAAIGDRTRPDSTGCPKCASVRAAKIRIKSIIDKRGSLASVYPDLLEEWDYEKNTDVAPESLTPSSGKKVGWKCKSCGYKWIASVSHRTNGRGCPYCNHQIVIAGKNDLATLKPELMEEWNYEENSAEGLCPTKLSIGTGKKAHWKCSVCGYEWQASIASRASGHGCPNFRKHKQSK